MSTLEQNIIEPLAARLRPKKLSDFVGQSHLLGKNKPLRQAILSGRLYSLIFWGPPGTGKTTLAEIIVNHSDARLEKLSAVLSGVKDIRAAVDRAKQSEKSTILFVDEVHRFNKAQQDAFLPFVEDGTVTFIGATTENPSFALNNALLSRARVYVLKPLQENDLSAILSRAIVISEQLFNQKIIFPDDLQVDLINASDGDARRLLNFFEMACDLAVEKNAQRVIEKEILKEVISASLRRFDNKGDDFYDQISALHKAVRGSNPDAALYWFARMIDGGCDPLYIARRVLRMASEDIGNADPRALTMALEAWQTYERLGSPEGELALAQAIVYLAIAAKSNAIYTATKEAFEDVKQFGSLEVPLHIRNAPTKLMKNLNYGKNYRYAHDEQDAFSAGQTYFPEKMGEKIYYHPTARGLEIKIKEKLDKLRKA